MLIDIVCNFVLLSYILHLLCVGANILRGVAGAGVLAGFDKFKAMYIKWRLGYM